jgi:5'-nucleotidase
MLLPVLFFCLKDRSSNFDLACLMSIRIRKQEREKLLVTMKATLIHFNDLYNVEKAPKFVRAVATAQVEAQDAGRICLTVFSGDAFSPSSISTTLRGKQMTPVLNALKVDCACLGNHDLDFGVVEFEQLKKECNFPWICSNVRSIELNQPLGGCHEYVIIEKNGLKLLVLGLVEFGWMETLSSINPQDVEFEEYVDYVKRRVPEIKAKEGPFDLVIASSHMRMPNDYLLAEECHSLIDIVLGGHDHHYEDSIIKGMHVLNSGTDFEDFTIVNVNGVCDITTERVTIGSDMEEDAEMVKLIHCLSEEIEKGMDLVVGKTKVDLDARFSQVRTKETNIANFCASVLARATGADVVILNSGSIRADRIIPAGLLKVHDLCDLLPSTDSVAVVAITGEKLLSALENGVSQYPAMEGRFPCVDGVRFAFDPSNPPGSRIVKGSVYVRDRVHCSDYAGTVHRRGETKQHPIKEKIQTQFSPLEITQLYHVCSKSYLLAGKDGYDALKDAPVVLGEELCPVLPTLLRNCFTEIAVMRRWEGLTTQRTVIKAANIFKTAIASSEVDPYAIAPTVDGRITNILEG